MHATTRNVPGKCILLLCLLALRGGAAFAQTAAQAEAQDPARTTVQGAENTAAGEEPFPEDYMDMGEDSGLTITADPGGDPATPEVSAFGQRNTVSAARIEEQGSRDLLDSLRNVPGVSFSKQNSIGGDTGTSLYIRGRGAGHPALETITNFDGVPRNGAIYGQSMPDSFSPGIADSITVYKSPQPSAFGAGYALVDVSPRYMRNEGQEVDLGSSFGSFFTLAENASFGYKKKAFDIFAAQEWISTAGHTDHSEAYRQNYYLNTGWTFSPAWNLRLLGNYINAFSERPPKDGDNRDVLVPSFRTDSLLGTLTLANVYDKAEGHIKFYYSGTEFHFLDESPPDGYSIQTLIMPGIRLRETLRLWKGSEIIAGGDFDFSILSNLNHKTSSPVLADFPEMLLCSPYIAASQTLSFGKYGQCYLIPQAGLRGYLHSLWANTATPQFGLVAGYKETSIYGNYALGCVYPSPQTIQGLAEGRNGGFAGDVMDSLKSVHPEVVYHYEAGITHRFGNTAVLGGSVFYDDGRNRIISQGPLPGNATLMSYFRITGLELYASLKPIEGLSFFAGGTWMKAEARGEDALTATIMPFTPDSSFSAGFSWNLGCFALRILEDITLSGDYRFLGGLYSGSGGPYSANFMDSSDISRLADQHILHLRASYATRTYTWRFYRVEIFADVNNVLNQRYEYWRGSPMPGIAFTGGFNLKFK
jgi:iron complex outermembrane receptor protein